MKRMNKSSITVFAAVFLALLFAAIPGCAVLNRVRGSGYPLKYADEIKAAAKANGLDPFLVAAVVSTESSFRENAVSGDGAEGLMQVLPSTAEWIDFRRGTALEEDGLFDPATNLDYGCWLLKYLLDRYDGNERYALIAYNASYGRLDGWLKDPGLIDENGELSVIPYAETRAYVEKIALCKDYYEVSYAEELGEKTEP